jgi:hypothetical protein
MDQKFNTYFLNGPIKRFQNFQVESSESWEVDGVTGRLVTKKRKVANEGIDVLVSHLYFGEGGGSLDENKKFEPPSKVFKMGVSNLNFCNT